MLYMAAKKPIGLRLDPELVSRIDAQRGDVSRTRWIERAVEHGLRVWEAPTRSADPFVEAPKVTASWTRPASALLDGPMFKCRVCDFSAPSANAKCPRHPGQLIPIREG